MRERERGGPRGGRGGEPMHARASRREYRTRRALRGLLRLYPFAFRRELGADLVETAAYRWREAVGRPGWRGVVGGARFWATEGVRFALDGLLERAQALPSVRDEVAQATRHLRRAPGPHALAVITLALGVGATAGVLTVADAVVFRPLPYEGADALVVVRSRFGAMELTGNSLLNVRDLQGLVRELGWIGAAQERAPALTEAGREPRRVATLDVTPEYLSGLGARVTVGRPFGARDFAAGAERVALVSHALWRSGWGGAPSVVGSTIHLDEVPYRVVGVVAAGFRDPAPLVEAAPTDAWLPVRDGDRAFLHRDQYSFGILGRVADGASLETVRRGLTAAGRALAAAHPAVNRVDGVDLDLVPYALRDLTVGGVRERLLLLAGGSLLLLLLACANAANLFLARGVTRAGELTVRSALGATRGRLALQLFLEAAATSVLAGLAGGVLGAMMVRGFVAVAPAGMPRLHEVSLDARALLIVASLTVLSAVVFGTLPALRGARAGASAFTAARTTATRSSQRLQSALVVAEVALSLVLVAGSALLLHSFARMLRVHPGFDGTGVTAVAVGMPLSIDTHAAQSAYYGGLVDRARAEPGVAHAALAFSVPGDAHGAWNVITPDHRASDAATARSRAPAYGASPGDGFVRINPVSADYFAALGIPLRAGRGFDGDPGAGDALVAIVNEAAARHLFPGTGRPIGRALALGPPGSPAPFREVVGIVGDVRQRGAAEAAEPQVYLPYRQRDVRRLQLIIDGGAASVDAATIARIVHDAAPGVPIDGIASLGARYAATAAETRFLALLLTAFAGVGVLLAAAGTYATATHALSLRVRELAIRAALGARPAAVFRLAVARALGVALVGIGIGLVLTLALGRLLAGHVFGIGPRDPVTLAAAAGFNAACVAAAASWSARRAARVDATTVLRD